MRVPGWVVVLAMMINAALLMVLKSLPQASMAYYIVPPVLAALGVFLGLVKSPISVAVEGAAAATETTTLTTTTTTPTPPTPKGASGKASISLLAFIAISALAFGAALAFAGCASGADGLRQACTNADRTIEGGYQAAGSAYKLDQEKMRAKLAANTITGAQADSLLIAHKNIIDKVLAALDGLKASKIALCSAIPAVEAGQRKDTAQLITSISQIVAAVPPLIEAIGELSTSVEVPPEPERLAYCAWRCNHV